MMRKIKLTKSAFLALFLAFAFLTGFGPTSATGVTSAQAAVVNDIDVRGNQRIDDEIIISYITISPGVRFNDFDIDESVKALYTTGLFSDVSIYQQGVVLIVEVGENGTVNKVFFEGNKRLNDDILKNAIQLKPRTVYSDERAAADAELINLAYSRVGREDAEVNYEVVPLANNRVNVIFRINEGDKTKISQIIFVGNNTFSDRRLADVISTKESGLLSFLQTNDIFDENKVRADEELLRRYYFNQGFADFQIISTTADLDEVANEYVLTITMEEGPRYTFGNILIESSIPGIPADGLYQHLETESGEHYSAADVEDSIVNLTEQAAEDGYAFVEVAPRGNRNFETNTIDVTYLVDEGARVYIEDIRIYGNDRTRDYVIRREFELSEGDAYNKVLVQKTRRRLEALGFFQSVQITTRPGSSPDRLLLIVTVIEQSTGELSLSGGFSSSNGISGEVSFSERNFLGRGQFIKLSYSGSADDTSYSFQFVEPFFLGYRISAGFLIQATESEDTDDRQYSVDSLGTRVSFGIPITDKLASSVFYTFNDGNTSASSLLLEPPFGTSAVDVDGPPEIQGNTPGELSNALATGVLMNGGDWMQSGIGYSLTYADLDNVKSPREGWRLAISQTFFGVGGDASYFSTEGSAAVFHTLSEEMDLIWFNRARAGHIEILGADNGTNFRTLDNFQARTNQIRGFDSFGYGPRDPVTGDALGGRTYWNATSELQFPLPFVPRNIGLRGAVFADTGMLFDVGAKAIMDVTASNPGLGAAALAQLDDDELRASFGGSIMWDSPFGPLRLDYAVPINDQAYDRLREISFGASSRF